MSQLQSLSIQARLILLVILPVSMLSCVMLFLNGKDQFEREEHRLVSHAMTTAKFVAAVVHTKEKLHDTLYLHSLLQASQLADEHYLSLRITDLSDHTLATLGNPFVLPDLPLIEDITVIEQANRTITAAKIHAAEEKRSVLGYVLISLDKQSLTEDFKRKLYKNILIVMLALLLCAALVYWVSRSISQPIRDMTMTMKSLMSGHHQPANVKHKLPEIDTLQSTLNQISREMQHAEASMRERIQDAQAQLRYQARHDTLTGLVNRQELERRLQQALEDVKQHRANHIFCYMDLDQFRIINDTCGHLAGDEMLRQISLILAQRIRAEDTFARLGGDEFGLLLSYCNVEKAIEIAAQLRQMVESFRFIHEGRLFQTGISIGIVEITPDMRDAGLITRHADAACDVAKDHGRNQVHLFHPEDAVLLKRHVEMEWVSKINEAIDHNDFVLYCQSIYPLQDKTLPGFHEILIRKRNDRGGVVQPAEFLPSAERYHLMTKIDRWVIQHTFVALQPLFQQGIVQDSFLVSINLSGMSLGDPTLLAYIQDALDTYEIPPRNICFEVTETSAIINIDNTIRLMTTLQKLGVRFMLDDFGSGMSSFSYLKHLPVNFLKMDGTYVRDITKNPVDLAMTKAIQSVAESMQIQTIAEYVENEETLTCLKHIGVSFVQGFYLNKPQPLNDEINRQLSRLKITSTAALSL